MADGVGEIFRLLPLAARAIGPIGKDRTNEGQHYKYRGIEDVLNAIHPVFTDLGIFIVPEVLEGSGETFKRQSRTGEATVHRVTLKVCYTLYAPDGSFVKAVVSGEGEDHGDKATNKAMSGALKYMLNQVLCIPFDAVDSEDTRLEPPPSVARELVQEAMQDTRQGPLLAQARTEAVPQVSGEAEPRPDLNDASMTTGVLGGVIPKSDKSKTHRMCLKGQDRWYSTFSDTVGAQMQELKNCPVKVYWKQKGEFFNAVWVEPQE